MSTLLMTEAPAAVPTALIQGSHLGLGEAIVFGVVALITMACGIGVLTAKRVVDATINMIDIMISLAILCIVNGSPFMDITQVAVYTDAVITLVLFVIMLVSVGGDEPVDVTGAVMRRPVLILPGLKLADAPTAVTWRPTPPKPAGLKGGARAIPDLLIITLYHDHVATMELTAILFIVIAIDTLTLTHRQRTWARLSQRAVAAGKVQDYVARGAHPGQKPMPGVYASANFAAAPALDAQGEAAKEFVPQVLRARDQGLELSGVSLEMGLAQHPGTVVSRLARTDQAGRAGDPRDACRSGMPFIPGAAAPTVKQPVLNDDKAVDSTAPEQREEK